MLSEEYINYSCWSIGLIAGMIMGLFNNIISAMCLILTILILNLVVLIAEAVK